MNRLYMIRSVAVAWFAASCVAAPSVLAQPAAMKQMQDTQRKAQQKARDAKKKPEQSTDAQKSTQEKPASAP